MLKERNNELPNEQNTIQPCRNNKIYHEVTKSRNK